ncbi:urea transporter [Agromyces aerolatus]|uniref:urea transporter n=1 Tax=Agromyces sp. LY-1074 TaxID=3074080 RepID=UPI00285A609C|nr:MULTISPECIES: urea transporter [unclassified Agromyces]MDR5699404.1 urea transporter [Agromyces sp. LY-1074]MDR5705700.1 urea transporter [Agromyces sp. LY-1358]
MGGTRHPDPTTTWHQWALGALRGPSQIFFQQNVVTGALVLIAFVIADWRMGVLALIGAVGGMLGGRAVGFPPSSVASGMQSFCGTLVGAAVFAALGGDAWWSYVLAFAGGLATGPVTWLVDALFTRTRLAVFSLPSTTAPFVIVATVVVLATLPLAVDAGPSDLPDEPVAAFFLSILTNVSQVVLVDHPLSGAVILIGLFIASRPVGLAALLGSVLGSATAVALGESWSEVANGLTNYSGVLTAIALTVTFLTSSAASWLYALPWIVVTAVVTLFMHRAGLETYTWPYILTTWAALIVAHSVRALRRA